MTIGTQRQNELVNEGYEWVTINVNGIEREGYVKWDDDEFIEHGSGDEFERPISLTYDQQEECYRKKYF